ncbi:MAG: response regulator [Planctomycetota bacterium]|nr:MAG: response regulator [Planctomycetota bacterium]
MEMNKIRVLIVDDSPLVRKAFRLILQKDPAMEVVGEGKTGKEAIELTRDLQPNMILMDIQMPEMNGLEAMAEIMATHPVPILVITGQEVSHDEGSLYYQALELGALDLIQKPAVHDNHQFLLKKIRILSKVPVIRHIQRRNIPHPEKAPKTLRVSETSKESFKKEIKIILIGASAGGPRSLSLLLNELEKELPFAFGISLHHPEGTTENLVQWLQKYSALPVVGARNEELLQEGRITVVPAGYHMVFDSQGRIQLKKKTSSDIFVPSIDRMFKSAARVFGDSVAAILLSGMGDDGVEGMAEVLEKGGKTVVEDEASSLVYGMGKRAWESRVAQQKMEASEIGRWINSLGRTMRKFLSK